MARFSLLTKLLLAILTPTVISFAGFAVLGHFAAAQALEAELGRRLAGIAALAATQISEESVALLSPGDEESRTYRNLRRRLLEVRDATGVARVYLFAADLTALVDTDEVPIGTRYYGLETSRAELRQVFPSENSHLPRPVSSLLFRGRGKDTKLYKSGYAPILSGQGSGRSADPVRFAVGVDGSAALYADLLGLRKTLLWVGSGGVIGMVLLAVIFGLGLTRPLRRLLDSARLIGSGVLDEPVRIARRSRAAFDKPGGDEVTELAEGLEAMRQALRTRDERMQMMLSGIAHEVRNPLGGMELFAGLLAEELQAAAESSASRNGSEKPLELDAMRGYVQRIKKELGHLQAVVSDFLEYARRVRPVLRPLPVLDLLTEVRDSVGVVAGVTVTIRSGAGTEPNAAPLLVAGDATQLRRALLNLCHNAVQACAALPADDPRPRTVELSAQLMSRREPTGAEVQTSVRLSIRDSGPGIPEEALPKIWTPFFTTRAQGTGLGLAFVREIISDHGGDITVTTGPSGTCFEVTLPVPPSGSRQ